MPPLRSSMLSILAGTTESKMYSARKSSLKTADLMSSGRRKSPRLSSVSFQGGNALNSSPRISSNSAKAHLADDTCEAMDRIRSARSSISCVRVFSINSSQIDLVDTLFPAIDHVRGLKVECCTDIVVTEPQREYVHQTFHFVLPACFNCHLLPNIGEK